MLKILNVVGTRPNLMKMAPLVACMQQPGIDPILLHTGQHYDDRMSQIFFDELGLPKPDIYLDIGSGSHAEQTAKVMVAFEKVLQERRPDLVVVVGDVNSTLACALTASKLWVPVAHVEAGLRSFDRRMPEEINRIVTDALSDFLFTPSRDGDENLLREGISNEKIFFVGNVMIDTLNKHRAMAEQLGTPAHFGLSPGGYGLLTLHRPANVDDPAVFGDILTALLEIEKEMPILFAVHPRTRQRIEQFGFQSRLSSAKNLRLVEPLGYLEFLDLMAHAQLVFTDSGGIQEETTILNVPCLTLRENTERPITITEGTNELVGVNKQHIVTSAKKILNGHSKVGRVPDLWDGQAAQRIVAILRKQLG
ncbi:MAG: UDP-N-acetylglucosamine 2-epimerase (non-hydrolyzing) [Anaerolineae bacterium]|nr:UDP-N-acetylglucosamine 2-epimerase (non-hydrolyzing) [Anaerolineae bacterium]